MKKLLLFTIFIFSALTINAQVGIGTDTPEAALDITATDSGILIPRVALSSTTDATTVTNPDTGLAPATGTLVFNNGTGGLTEAGFYHWDGTRWNKLIDDTPNVYFGSFIINSNNTGPVDINLIPFQPKRVTFTAYARVGAGNLNSNSGNASVNTNNRQNFHGSMKGYAFDNGASIMQQVIFGGGSGASINDVSRYSSNANCIGLRYANQDGLIPNSNFGVLSATLTSFNGDGFSLDVTSTLGGSINEPVLVIYEAYRY